MRRKLIALIVLAGAAAIALFVVFQSRSYNQETSNSAVLFKNIIAGQAPSETLPSDINQIAPVQETSLLPEETAKSVSINATESAASAIAKELIAKNPDGPSLLSGKSSITAINPDTLVENALAESLANFDPESVKPRIPLSTIKVIATNTPEALTAYLRAFQSIIAKNSTGANLNPSLNSPAELIPLEQALQKTVEDFYALPVPAPLASLHREEISLLIAEKNIISAIIKAINDPLASLLSLQMWPDVNNGFASVSHEFIDFVAKNHITL